MRVNYTASMVPRDDIANKQIQGKEVVRTVKLMLFTTIENASWAADRLVKAGSYPVAHITFRANRDIFRLEPGDPFVLNYPKYGISGAVYRVTGLQEEDVKSEEIIISAIEDIDHATGIITEIGMEGFSSAPDWTMDYLDYVAVLEAPFPLAEEGARSEPKIGIIPCAARKWGDEVGYYLYYSLDGDTYERVAVIKRYNPYGTLAQGWPTRSPFRIGHSNDVAPAEEAICVDFVNPDASVIESCSRENLFAGRNLAMVGNELISFQNITPVDGYDYRYEITDIYRARVDTVAGYHPVGEAFWFVGNRIPVVLSLNELVKGATRYFKIVPFSFVAAGDVSDATAIPVTVTGRSRIPYIPGNFNCNGQSFRATYNVDDPDNAIHLTWSPRYRGQGAGIGNPDEVVDAAPTWEGYFEIEVWVGQTLCETVTAVNDDEYTFTQTDIEGWSTTAGCPGEPCLPSVIGFKLKNYRTFAGTTYSSAKVSLRVACEPDEGPCDCGSATTSTTTTCTTSSTSTFTTTSSSTTWTSTTTSTSSTTSTT